MSRPAIDGRASCGAGPKADRVQVRPRGLVEAADRLEQRRRIDRFGDVIVHARGETPLALLDGGVRRHRDDRQRRQARIGSQLAVA